MVNLPNPFPGFKSEIAPNNQQPSTPAFKAHRAGKNGVYINFIIDESGSMQSCYDATITGFNEYLLGQKNTPGDCWITLTKFDAPNIKTVYEKTSIHEVPNLDKNNYRPGGGTNLLDAIGETITKVNSTLGNLKRHERPAVLFTIITDGQENSSRTYNNDMIRDMIKGCEKAGYSFVYLGANQDAFAAAAKFGVAATHAFTYSTDNMAQTMNLVSSSTSRYRSAVAKGVDSETLNNQDYFTDEERKQQSK